MNEIQNIKVYNIKERIEQEDFDGRKMTTYRESKIAVVEGPSGVSVFTDEGIGQILGSMDDKYEVQLAEQKEGGFSTFPDAIINPPLKALIYGTSVEEMPVRQFIRRFGRRLDVNFAITLQSFDKIGLKKEAFYKKGKKGAL